MSTISRHYGAVEQILVELQERNQALNSSSNTNSDIPKKIIAASRKLISYQKNGDESMIAGAIEILTSIGMESVITSKISTGKPKHTEDDKREDNPDKNKLRSKNVSVSSKKSDADKRGDFTDTWIKHVRAIGLVKKEVEEITKEIKKSLMCVYDYTGSADDLSTVHIPSITPSELRLVMRAKSASDRKWNKHLFDLPQIHSFITGKPVQEIENAHIFKLKEMCVEFDVYYREQLAAENVKRKKVIHRGFLIKENLKFIAEQCGNPSKYDSIIESITSQSPEVETSNKEVYKSWVISGRRNKFNEGNYVPDLSTMIPEIDLQEEEEFRAACEREDEEEFDRD